jgi:hypothetical protein
MNTFTCQSNNNSGNSGRSGNFASAGNSASKSGKVCLGPFCSRGSNSGNVEEAEEEELEFYYE